MTTNPWELILHHSYTGTPGVIFDQSPRRGSHGTAVNLPDSAFSVDGAEPGSGAVSFEGGGSILVRASESWRPLGAIRTEVRLRRNQVRFSFDTIYDAGSFNLVIRGENIFAFFSGTESHHFSLRSPGDFVAPAGEWITITIIYDGISTAQLYVNGDLVSDARAELWPLIPPQGVMIGADASGNFGLNGKIDDLKIWRLKPYRADDDFTRRPMAPAVSDCWKTWGREFEAAWERMWQANSECTEVLVERLNHLRHEGLADALVRVPDGDTRWREAAAEYRRLWDAGRPDEINPILQGLLQWMRDAGLDPAQNADLQELINSPYWNLLMGETPPLTCDPAFTRMLAPEGATDGA
jgi:hypothetical protein